MKYGTFIIVITVIPFSICLRENYGMHIIMYLLNQWFAIPFFCSFMVTVHVRTRSSTLFPPVSLFFVRASQRFSCECWIYPFTCDSFADSGKWHNRMRRCMAYARRNSFELNGKRCPIQITFYVCQQYDYGCSCGPFLSASFFRAFSFFSLLFVMCVCVCVSIRSGVRMMYER